MYDMKQQKRIYELQIELQNEIDHFNYSKSRADTIKTHAIDSDKNTLSWASLSAKQNEDQKSLEEISNIINSKWTGTFTSQTAITLIRQIFIVVRFTHCR